MSRKATDYDGVSSVLDRISGEWIHHATLNGTLIRETVSDELADEINSMVVLKQTIPHIEEMRRGSKGK